MNKRIFHSFAGLLLTLWLVIGLQTRIAAAGISVAPLKQEISLRPGEEGKLTITLNYNSRSPLDIPQAQRFPSWTCRHPRMATCSSRMRGLSKIPPASGSRCRTMPSRSNPASPT